MATREMRLTYNTYETETETGRVIRFHETDILTETETELTINTGGWPSKTTADRLDRFVGHGGRFRWSYRRPDYRVEWGEMDEPYRIYWQVPVYCPASREMRSDEYDVTEGLTLRKDRNGRLLPLGTCRQPARPADQAP